jgi:ATP-grasp ribosomal peptide maturase
MLSPTATPNLRRTTATVPDLALTPAPTCTDSGVTSNATILVLTGRADITADAVVDELRSRGERVVRFDTADFPVAATLAATLTDRGWDGHLVLPDRAIALANVKSVWWRRPNEFRTPSTWSADGRAFAVSEARAGLLGVLASLPARWINHPSRDAACNYKPLQLAVAVRAGLRVPGTVITSDPEHARQFVASDPAIYKALGGGVMRADGRHHAVPTTLVTAEDLDESVAATATLLQRYVDKAFDVRLTVIGERMFPVAIHAGSPSARLDWRTDYSSLAYDADIAMPPGVTAGVPALMRELGLYFGALDFAVHPDGSWWFLEINANGNWHWLVKSAGVPLVQAMADALQEGLT